MKHLMLVSLLFLGGCADTAARFYANSMEDYDDTRTIVRSYVGDNVSDRRWVREQCRWALKVAVASLQATGTTAAVFELLRKHYPPAVTTAMLDDGAASLNVPHICGKETPE